MQISKDHGHACSMETIGSDVAVFRYTILTLRVLYKRMPKEIYIVGNLFLVAKVTYCGW